MGLSSITWHKIDNINTKITRFTLTTPNLYTFHLPLYSELLRPSFHYTLFIKIKYFTLVKT